MICTRLLSDSRRSCATSSAVSSRRSCRQPAQQGIRGFVRRRRLVDLLAQVQQVGEAALAVVATEHARAHLLLGEEAAVHDAHALAQPDLAVPGEALEVRHQLGLVCRDRRDAGGVAAHHFGGQRAAQEGVARRLVDRDQHALDFLGIGRVEHARLRQLDAADAQPGELALQFAALRVRAHQRGDVAGAQGAPVDGDAAGDAFADQACDLSGRRLRGVRLGVLLGDRRAVRRRGSIHTCRSARGRDRSTKGLRSLSPNATGR